MSIPQARKKTGGRKKGTPNKKTQDLIEVLNSYSFNIPEKIMNLLPDLRPEKQVDVLLKLMDYIYPKRKAIELIDDNPKVQTPTVIQIVGVGSKDEN